MASSTSAAVWVLDEHLEAPLTRGVEQIRQVVGVLLVEEPDDQEDHVGLDDVQLRLVENEVLPEHRHVDGLAYAFERLRRPAEMCRLGQHRQRGRAALDHLLGEFDRVVGPLAIGRRTRRLHLGDDRNSSVFLGDLERPRERLRFDGETTLDTAPFARRIEYRPDRRCDPSSLEFITEHSTYRYVHKGCDTGSN